jgi:hypothetical protein
MAATVIDSPGHRYQVTILLATESIAQSIGRWFHIVIGEDPIFGNIPVEATSLR